MDQNRRQLLIAIGLGGAAWLITGAACAEKKYDVGATDTEIKIGNTGPYSGPASSYSTIWKCEAAYFRMINAQGGINGRKINFISYDDAYSPPKTVEQVRKLVESDEVGRPRAFPVDDRLSAQLPERGPDLCQLHSRETSRRQDRRAVSERRLRQGLREGPQRRARRQGQVDDRHGGAVRDDRSDRRFADGQSEV